MAHQFDLAAVGTNQAQCQTQGRGFAGSVRPQQAMTATRRQFQIKSINDDGVAVAFAELANAQGR
jgi:hypothetical protein